MADSNLLESGSWSTSAPAGAPPVLSLPTETSITNTTATIGCTTDEATGTLYYYVSKSATAPSIADLKAGTGAEASGSQASPGVGTETFALTGLDAYNTYYSYFVHNDTDGDSNVLESGPWATTGTYSDFLAALGADHHWDFDGDSLDQIGSVNGTNTSISFAASAIAEDATNCAETNATGDRVALATTTNINNSAQERKCVMGTFMTTAVQPPPKRIYGEGNNTTCFQLVMWVGNFTMFEATEPTNFPDGLQVYGPRAELNRAYHFTMIFEGNNYGNEIRFYVDGVEMVDADPADRQPDTASLDARGVAEFADPAGTVGVGGNVVLLNAPVNGRYNHWATWGDKAEAVLTDAQAREAFEKSCLANQTISTGTESAMQTALDAIDNEEKGNHPCCIRIEGNTGDTDFTLEGKGITYDSRASIHVQYTGTATLTWRDNIDSNTTIFSTIRGGTIVVERETSLTLNGLANPTDIRVFEAGTTTLIDSEEGITDGDYSVNLYQTSVDIRIISLGEKIFSLLAVDTSADTTLELAQQTDRSYENP